MSQGDCSNAISTQATKLTITLLDHDVLRHIFSFLRASDLDNGVAGTCEVLREVALSPTLWRDLCNQTGKSSDYALSSYGPPSIDSDFYYRLYHHILCVPLDHATIGEAIDARKRKVTITLMPGVYEERLVIKTSVRIRAADPKRGAAIVWYNPCQNHSVIDSPDSLCSHCGHGLNESIVEVEEPGACLSLHNLILLHYSEGTDLWHGNCAVYCHGDMTHTYLEGCSIQSDSGRGVVISNGAGVNVARSAIHDCAATGLYLGDEGSCLDLTTSNILRNGFGRRRPVPDNSNPPRAPTIQAGHSGLYVEASDCTIRNSFVAQNCLTGLSVVRDGNVHLSYSLFAGNGADPVVIFQEEGDLDDDDDHSVGAVYEHSNVFDLEIPSPEQMELTMLRCKWVYNRPLSRAVLNEIYAAS